MSSPHTTHYATVLRIVLHKRHFDPWYFSFNSPLTLHAYSHFDWAGDHGCSTIGHCFFP